MLDSKQEKVLFAVLKEYIETAEPVGSQTICRKYDLGYSPATVRSIMASLEDLEFLEQPHTSAGRVPLEKAYRYYVNRIMSRNISVPLPGDLTEEIRKGLGKSEMDDMINQASKLLARLTSYTSMVLAPRARKSLCRFLQLNYIDEYNVLVVLLSNTGFVANRVIRLSDPVTPEDLHHVAHLLNKRLSGVPLAEIRGNFLRRSLEHEDFNWLNREFLATVSEVIENLGYQADEKVYTEGATNLLEMPEFKDLKKLRELLNLLEEEKKVAEILSQSLYGSRLQVRLGSELPFAGIQDCAIIIATYGAGDEILGTMGVLGPLRMPYEKVIPVVRHVAASFGDILYDLGV